MTNKPNLILHLITIALLITLIVLQFLPSNSAIVDGDYVQQTLAEQRAMRDYQLSIGKNNISISNDKISKSTYSNYIIGDVTNNADKMIYGVSIKISFYKNNNFVSSASDYLDEISSKTSVNLEVYAPDDFDSYTIDYIKAYFLD